MHWLQQRDLQVYGQLADRGTDKTGGLVEEAAAAAGAGVGPQRQGCMHKEVCIHLRERIVGEERKEAAARLELYRHPTHITSSRSPFLFAVSFLPPFPAVSPLLFCFFLGDSRDSEIRFRAPSNSGGLSVFLYCLGFLLQPLKTLGAPTAAPTVTEGAPLAFAAAAVSDANQIHTDCLLRASGVI